MTSDSSRLDLAKGAQQVDRIEYRPTTWGKALRSEVTDRGGLKGYVERIEEALGPTVGSRNTFAKLFHLTAAPEDRADRFRAWLLITAIGLDPDEWGCGDIDVPRAVRTEVLAGNPKKAGRVTRGDPLSVAA